MPLFYVHQSPVIGVWKIVEPWQELLDLFQNKTLYADEVLTIHSDKRKSEWLAVRLLLKHLTGAEMLVDYKDHGAPFLKNYPYNISISHTKGYAALILSKHTNPGIDIEHRSGRALKLCKKFINTQELEQLNLLLRNHLHDPELFATICWCAKETAFKALQENGVDFIKHFHISPFTLSNKGDILLKETKTHRQESYQIHYQITDDFIITWKE